MATGQTAKLRNMCKKGNIWRLWSGTEIIKINAGAGAAMATGKKAKLGKYM